MKRFGLILVVLLWSAAAALAAGKSKTVVVIDGAKYYVHTVGKGETLYGLARTYGVGERVILSLNPAAAGGLKAGAKLKIPFTAEAAGAPSERKLRKTFDTHTVAEGETLYAISRRYAIPLGTLIEDNPSLDPIRLRPGERILVRRKERGTEPAGAVQAQWESYRENLNSVADEGYAYHMVAAGETFYALARRFGTTEARLSELNGGLQPAGLKAGAIIKVPSNGATRASAGGTAPGKPEDRRAGWPETRPARDAGGAAGTEPEADAAAQAEAARGKRTEDATAPAEAIRGADGAARTRQDEAAAWSVPAGTAETEFGGFAPDALFGRLPRTDSVGTGDTTRLEVDFRPLGRGETLRVALMLPLAVHGVANANYLEFYQGFLLGLDSVKRAGYSVHVDLFNTERNAETVRRIVEEDEAFRNADLVVGPVYEQPLEPVVRFAELRGIPVVSPLANITGIDSDVLFQMAPTPERKYDKAADLTDGSKQITLIYSDRTDREFEAEIRSLIGDREYRKHHYVYEHASVVERRGKGNSPSDLTPLLQNTADNVFVVMADNELDVDRILAALASAYTSIVSRGSTPPRFVVLGNARWNRYNNLSREIFFKDHVVFLSSYHAKRDSETVLRFDSDYIRAFGSLPTLYSYRGYDTALIFAPAMFGDIRYDLDGTDYTPLQTTYTFGRSEGRGNHVNRNWTRVNYNEDYTIAIE